MRGLCTKMRSRAVSRTPGRADAAGPPAGPGEPGWGHHNILRLPLPQDDLHRCYGTQYSKRWSSSHYKMTSTKHHVSPCSYLFSRVQLFSDPMDCSPPGSSVHGISQARTLEWVAMSFSKASSPPRDWTCISCIGRWVLYCWATWEVPLLTLLLLLLSRFSRVRLCGPRRRKYKNQSSFHFTQCTPAFLVLILKW